MDNTIHIEQQAKHDIGVAREPDIGPVCSILADAFADDPVLDWLSGNPNIYQALFRSEMESLYKHHGQTYITRARTGAAMWLPPGVSTTPRLHWRLAAAFWSLVRTGGLKCLKRAEALHKTLATNHPREPHFYLHAIGTRKDNQGCGVGSALMKAGLGACDQLHVPAYLESSNEVNNSLYERHGFRVMAEAHLPDSGPTLWFMQRPAN